jgi:hypothetical protein
LKWRGVIKFANTDNDNSGLYVEPAKKDKIKITLNDPNVIILGKFLSRTKDILEGKKIEEKILYSKK